MVLQDLQFVARIPSQENVPPTGSDHVGGDCRGENFFNIDRALQDLLSLYLTTEEHVHFWPHFEQLGKLAGNELDEWAALSDKTPPKLHNRDRFGRDRQWIEYHPAYERMVEVGFYQFGIHAAPHRPILGWQSGVSPVVKFTLHYLFSQAEFGLMCPLAVTELAAMLVLKYGSDELKVRYGERMITLDPAQLLQGAQFMTEKAGGSDVGANELRAGHEDGTWRLYGEKWFCSNPDCGVAVLLARCEGDGPGTAGLTAFVVPRDLEDGTRNTYRIVRLKDKLGSRSLASGEIVYEGAVAHVLGERRQGIKILLDQVNMSRLSHGMRAAATMRRALNEAVAFGKSRRLFGKAAFDQPLFRRQIMQLLVPAEAALSTSLYGGNLLANAEAGSNNASLLLRIITPVIKMRSNRDNVRACAKALEVRGGNGVIEDWVNARLLRDSFVPVLWEGTSVINALDVVHRAIAKSGAHELFRSELHRLIDEIEALPDHYCERLNDLADQVTEYARAVAADPGNERYARLVTSLLYHVLSAVLLAWEGDRLGREGGDARRVLISRMIVEHHLAPQHPTALPRQQEWEDAAERLLLQDDLVGLEEVFPLLG